MEDTDAEEGYEVVVVEGDVVDVDPNEVGGVGTALVMVIVVVAVVGGVEMNLSGVWN